MNVYQVDSTWSKELIAAKTIVDAVLKYEKHNRKISEKDREIQSVVLLGALEK